MPDRRKDLARRERFEKMRRAKFERLRRVCQDWSRLEIELLSGQMTRLELKYEAWPGLSRPGSGDPVGA